MTGGVTVEEAKAINAYFRAVCIVKDLTDAAEKRSLSPTEARQLRENMARIDALRAQVKLINQRAFAA